MLDFIIDKERAVCFSGHRPEKLPFSGDESHSANKILKSLLFKEIEENIGNGKNCFITGLARGIDLWAGEIVTQFKAADPRIILIAALPHKAFTDKYKGYEKWICGNILLNADHTVYMSEKYHELCMRDRNYFMVDNSSKLIAVVNDKRSGTGQTIRYAQKQGIDIKILDISNISDDFNFEV